MNEQEALDFVELVLAETKKSLNDLQRAIFLGSWRGESYGQISQRLAESYEHYYAVEYIERDVAFKLWRSLSEALGKKVTKKNLRGPVEASAREKKAQKAPDVVPLLPENGNGHFWTTPNMPRADWGNAPDVSGFQGREVDLRQLAAKIRIEGCRLISIFGLGGIGKTFLSAKLAQQVRDQFDFVIWRSLKPWRVSDHSPSVSVLVGDLVHLISNCQDDSSDWLKLIGYLSDRRCLIILDGVESLLQKGVHDGSYQPGYAEYGQFFQHISKSVHDSCFILTSREKPRDVEAIDHPHACVWKLEGFGAREGQQFLESRRCFAESVSDWRSLIRRYSGHPIALSNVASNIFDLFDGNITSFLDQTEMSLPYKIRSLFDEQLERVSELEHSILKYLTEFHEPIKLNVLQNVLHSTSGGHLQEALLSLRRRSLIELNYPYYSLQMMTWEYLNYRFEDNIS